MVNENFQLKSFIDCLKIGQTIRMMAIFAPLSNYWPSSLIALIIFDG